MIVRDIVSTAAFSLLIGLLGTTLLALIVSIFMILLEECGVIPVASILIIALITFIIAISNGGIL